MRRGVLAAVAVVLTVALSGCQCVSLTEKYADHIDDISDHPPRLDWLYHPCFDLTRIGKPDWCQCPLNRLSCHRRCCDSGGSAGEIVRCPFCAEDHPPYDPQTSPAAGTR